MKETPSYRLYTAGAILLAYLILAGVLLSWIRGNIGNDSWNHIVVVFNAVGALATTASGVLFGAEVQQSNINAANHRAEMRATDVARKDQAILQALAHLDPAGGQQSTDDDRVSARSVLVHALASTSPRA